MSARSGLLPPKQSRQLQQTTVNEPSGHGNRVASPRTRSAVPARMRRASRRRAVATCTSEWIYPGHMRRGRRVPSQEDTRPARDVEHAVLRLDVGQRSHGGVHPDEDDPLDGSHDPTSRTRRPLALSHQPSTGCRT